MKNRLREVVRNNLLEQSRISLELVLQRGTGKLG